MNLNLVLEVIKNVVDIIIVWSIFYVILKNIKNNVKLSLLFKGILFIIILKIISDKVGFVTVGLLLEYIIEWGPLALIVIFQPEIRTILEQLGRTQLLGRHKVLTVDERERLVYEIVKSIEYMKKSRIGALIVLERDVSLQDYIDKSVNIYAELSESLLESIFFPNNPLHDGGVIIQGDKISCAGAVFPTTNNPKMNKRLGTRHRAAVGITEGTDAIAIIVSEETGRVSAAIKGDLYYNLAIDDVKLLLIDELRPKQEDFEEDLEEVEK